MLPRVCSLWWPCLSMPRLDVDSKGVQATSDILGLGPY